MIALDLGCASIIFTDRHGGVSRPPFDSLNLAGHVGDDAASVAVNYERLAALVATRPEPAGWVRPLHVHGATVLRVEQRAPTRAEADGAATTITGLPLVALGADCAPIALADDVAVAALHAGWRGLEAGVVEAGIAAVRALGRGPVRAAIGPCICARHYEFGEADLVALTARFGPAVAGHTDSDRPAFDLPGAIRVALERAGVLEVHAVGICTVESPDHFSFRRDGRTGRQAVVVVKRT